MVAPGGVPGGIWSDATVRHGLQSHAGEVLLQCCRRGCNPDRIRAAADCADALSPGGERHIFALHGQREPADLYPKRAAILVP